MENFVHTVSAHENHSHVTEQPTPRIRWLVTMAHGKTLQQYWSITVHSASGTDLRGEWRDVPVEVETF